MKTKYQKGSVMLETAIVLPIVLLAVLTVLEAVNYGSDRLLLNSVLTDMTEVFTVQANETSRGNPQGPFVCSIPEGSEVEKVDFDGTQETYIQDAVLNVQKKVAAHEVEVNQLGYEDSTKSYAYQVHYPYKGVIVPDIVAEKLRVYASLLITVDLHCR